MPIDIYCDYIQDSIGEEWQPEYFLPIEYFINRSESGAGLGGFGKFHGGGYEVHHSTINSDIIYGNGAVLNISFLFFHKHIRAYLN